MHAHITYRREDADALSAAGVQGLVLALDDDLEQGDLAAGLDEWAQVRSGVPHASRSAEQTLEHYKELLAKLHDDSGAHSWVIWAGPELAQQKFVAFMMSVIPDSLESGEPLRLVELATAPAESDAGAIRSAEPKAIDDMHVRMAANVWQCVVDDMRIPAAELARMVEESMPAFARAMISWADD